MVEMGGNANTSSDQLAALAVNALQTIDALNEQIVALHDLILPKKSARGAVSRTAMASTT
jgi:hypothetical protein